MESTRLCPSARSNYQRIMAGSFLGWLLLMLLFTPSMVHAEWTSGAKSISHSFNKEDRTVLDLSTAPPYSSSKLTLFGSPWVTVGFQGGWDAGYYVHSYLNFGEGVDVSNDNPPQLITKTDAGLAAKAWVKAVGPGMNIDLFGFDPFEVNLLDFFGVNNTLLDEEVAVPDISLSLPFTGDGTQLADLDFITSGIYVGDYEKVTKIDVAKLVTKIPAISTVLSGEIGIARGFKGHIEFGLEGIHYLDGSSSTIGTQTSAVRGVDVSSHQGTTLTVSKRDYQFKATPSITAGITPYFNLTVVGLSVSGYFPNQESANPALKEVTLSTTLRPTLPLPLTGQYVVPSGTVGSVITPITPDPITPITVPPLSGQTSQARDLIAPSSHISISLANANSAWPKIVTITALDETDPNPAIYYAFAGDTPLSTTNYRGSGLRQVTISLTQSTTIYYFSRDASGNLESQKSQAVIAPRVTMWDVNLMDGEQIEAGKTYTKKWSIRNIGDVNLSGLEGVPTQSNHLFTQPPARIRIGSLSIGETKTVYLPFTVSSDAGTRQHTAYWKLIDNANTPVQVGVPRNSEFWLDLQTEGVPADQTVFMDVGKNSGMGTLVYNAVNKNIINPPGADNQWRFNPNDAVTRGANMKILIHALNLSYNTTGVPFTDVASNHPIFGAIQTGKNLGYATSISSTVLNRIKP